MFIKDILQLIIFNGTEMSGFLAEDDNWYAFKKMEHDSFLYPNKYEIDLGMTNWIYQTEEYRNFIKNRPPSLQSLLIQSVADSLADRPHLNPLDPSNLRLPDPFNLDKQDVSSLKLPDLSNSSIGWIESNNVIPRVNPSNIYIRGPPYLNESYTNTLTLRPINTDLVEKLDTPSQIRSDKLTMRRLGYKPPYVTNWELENHTIIDYQLSIIRKNIMLSDIKWQNKIKEVITNANIGSKEIISEEIAQYLEKVYYFVDEQKKFGRYSESDMKKNLDMLFKLRNKLNYSIDRDIDFHNVKNSIEYPEILQDTREYFCYRTDKAPVLSNENQYKCVLLDLSIETIDNVSSSAVCGIYPKK